MELVGEMSNVHTHCSDVGVKEVEVVVVTKLDERIGLLGMVSTGAWVEGLVC